MMRRYLGEAERAVYEALTPRRKRSWLLGRIAAKDAARRALWARGERAVFPVEIGVVNDPTTGAPSLVGPRAAGLHVSLAHKDDVAVAIVSAVREVGIDVEKIEPRSEQLAGVALTAGELALGADRPRDEWFVRLWTAKEAVAKERRTGMSGPKALEVTRVAGDTLWIGDTRVETVREGEHIIAWTEP
jgi:phosphopantetheinyl transferase (holo-ACP synthase)